MTTKEKIETLAIMILFAAALAFGFGILGGMIGYNKGVRECEARHQTDTVTVVRVDTLLLSERFVDTVIKVRQVPFYVKTTDTLVDSVWVELPMEQHHAHLEDTADVWYSGFNASLDSIRVYSRTVTEFVTTEKTVHKMPVLCANLGCGAFFHEKQPNMYLQADVSLNAGLWRFNGFAAVSSDFNPYYGISVSRRIDLIK